MSRSNAPGAWSSTTMAKKRTVFGHTREKLPRLNPTVDAVLDHGIDIMQLLQTAAGFSPVPYLSEAAGLVVAILQAVQNTRDNKDAFSRLAQHACILVSSVVIAQHRLEKEGKQLAPELVKSLELLVTELEPIKEFVTAKNARSGFWRTIGRFMNNRKEAGQIQEYKEKLEQALSEFQLRSNINIQIELAQASQTLEEINQMLRNFIEAFKMFATSAPSELAGESASSRHQHQTSDIMNYPSPTYYIGGNNIQGNYYSGVQGGVHYH